LALNKTFTCNILKDENDNDIDCYYQGYHIRTGTWNDVRYSENQQYSCNLGDGDWLTQDGEVFVDDIVLLCFWQNGDDRTGLKDRLCYILVTITSDSTYINDIQLQPKTAPLCGFTFTNNNPTINNELGIIPAINDDFTYSYNDITHNHKRYYGSELIFDSIGNLTLQYDWDDGNDWVDSDTKTYTEIGDHTISQRVTNSYDLSKICSQTISLKYNTPIPGLTFDYTDPIHTTEDVIVKAGINDIDSRITNIKHKLLVKDRGNGDLLQDITIEENTIVDYSYTRTIELLQLHYFTQVIYWDDGYDSQIINYSMELPITNWCPDVSLIKLDNTASDKTFSQTSNDLDGDIVGWYWKIFFVPPFSDGEYSEVYDYIATSGDDWNVIFTVQGSYKVQIMVTDDYGCSMFDEIIFDIAEENICNYTKLGDIKFIFPKQLGNH